MDQDKTMEQNESQPVEQRRQTHTPINTEWLDRIIDLLIAAMEPPEALEVDPSSVSMLRDVARLLHREPMEVTPRSMAVLYFHQYKTQLDLHHKCLWCGRGQEHPVHDVESTVTTPNLAALIMAEEAEATVDLDRDPTAETIALGEEGVGTPIHDQIHNPAEPHNTQTSQE